MRAEIVPTCAWPAAGEKIMGSSPISGTAFCCPGLSLLPRAPYRELQRSAPFAFLSLQPLDTFCPARHVHFVFLLRRVLFISLPGSVCSPVLLLLLLSWGALDESWPRPGNVTALGSSVPLLQREAASPSASPTYLVVVSEACAFCVPLTKPLHAFCPVRRPPCRLCVSCAPASLRLSPGIRLL